MFSIVKKLLFSNGGWMAAIPLVMSAVQMGLSQAQKGKSRIDEPGYSKMLKDRIVAGDQTWGLGEGGYPNTFLNPAIEAAKAGGLMPAISEAFSQRPSSAQMDAIAGQERQLKNQALNTGARGGLLRQQMFEAAKNAATNKLNITENARQNALQRAFQIFGGAAPTQAQALGWQQMGLGGTGNLLSAELQRNMANAGKAAAGQQQAGEAGGAGLGSILGGLGNLFPSMNGPISGATGTAMPSFSLPGAGEGFSNVFIR